MLSLDEIISNMTDEEREQFKEQIAAARQVESELRGIQARSLDMAADFNERLLRIFESLQIVTQTVSQIKKEIEQTHQAAEKALEEIRTRRNRDLQACLASIPDAMFARA